MSGGHAQRGEDHPCDPHESTGDDETDKAADGDPDIGSEQEADSEHCDGLDGGSPAFRAWVNGRRRCHGKRWA